MRRSAAPTPTNGAACAAALTRAQARAPLLLRRRLIVPKVSCGAACEFSSLLLFWMAA